MLQHTRNCDIRLAGPPTSREVLEQNAQAAAADSRRQITHHQRDDNRRPGHDSAFLRMKIKKNKHFDRST